MSASEKLYFMGKSSEKRYYDINSAILRQTCNDYYLVFNQFIETQI